MVGGGLVAGVLKRGLGPGAEGGVGEVVFDGGREGVWVTFAAWGTP
jgi:hypothetical protein